MDDREFGRLEAKVDGILAAFEDFRIETRQHREDETRWRDQFTAKLFGDNGGGILSRHGQRIAALERWRAWIAGGIAFLGTAGGILAWLRGLK